MHTKKMELTSRGCKNLTKTVIHPKDVIPESIDNAITATEKSKIRRVDIDVMDHGDDICISVMDWGTGIPYRRLQNMYNLGGVKGPGVLNQNGIGANLNVAKSNGVLVVTHTPHHPDYTFMIMKPGELNVLIGASGEFPYGTDVLNYLAKNGNPSTAVFSLYTKNYLKEFVNNETTVEVDDVKRRIAELCSTKYVKLLPEIYKEYGNTFHCWSKSSHLVDMYIHNYPAILDENDMLRPTGDKFKLGALWPSCQNVIGKPLESTSSVIHLEKTEKRQEKNAMVDIATVLVDDMAVANSCKYNLGITTGPMYSYPSNMSGSGVRYYENDIVVANAPIGSLCFTRNNKEITTHPSYNHILTMVNLGYQTPEYFETSPVKSETDTKTGDWNVLRKQFASNVKMNIKALLQVEDLRASINTEVFNDVADVNQRVFPLTVSNNTKIPLSGKDKYGVVTFVFPVKGDMTHNAILEAINAVQYYIDTTSIVPQKVLIVSATDGKNILNKDALLSIQSAQELIGNYSHLPKSIEVSVTTSSDLKNY